MGYLRVGRCKRCGRCCRGHRAIRGHNLKVLRDTAIILGNDPEIVDELLYQLKDASLDCKHLRWKVKNGRRIAVCAIYDRRPQYCRDYPAEPADLIEGCGYRFIGKVHSRGTDNEKL